MQGDADIFFPTDFGLLERIDHFCSGWLKLHEDASSKQGRKRRTIRVRLLFHATLTCLAMLLLLEEIFLSE